MFFNSALPYVSIPELKSSADPKYSTGSVVSPVTPQRESGTYWGYSVRFAHSFGAVFTEAPFEVYFESVVLCIRVL